MVEAEKLITAGMHESKNILPTALLVSAYGWLGKWVVERIQKHPFSRDGGNRGG